MGKYWKCYLNKKSLKKWGVCLIIAILSGMIGSIAAAGLQYVKEGKDNKNQVIAKDNIQIDNIEIKDENYLISEKGSKLIITFPKKKYISKLQYTYVTPVNKKSSISIYADNVYGDTEKKEIIDYYKAVLQHSTININSKVSKIEIEFEADKTGMAVTDFEIKNEF